MDFTLPPRIEEYRARIARFVEDEILPVENDRSTWDAHGNIAAKPLEALRDKARDQGLWCLQLKPETGGQGLGRLEELKKTEAAWNAGRWMSSDAGGDGGQVP